MTEHEKRIVGIMEHCVLDADFCDSCKNNTEDYPGCRKTHEDFFKVVKDVFAQRDALLSDINLACGGKFVDVCCICDHYTPEHPASKCELKGMACRWEWRGVQNG